MTRVLVAILALLLPLGTFALSPKTCTLEYAPVCGSLEVECIKEPCNPIEQTYSNRCFMEAEGASFVHEGECTEEEYGTASPSRCSREYVPVCGEAMECPACTKSEPPCMAPCVLSKKTYGNRCMLESDAANFLYEGVCTADESVEEGSYVPPENCVSWFDGCNHCSRGEGGTAMCTLRACVDTPAKGYCISYGGGADAMPPPVITSPEEVSEEDQTVSEETSPQVPSQEAEKKSWGEELWGALTSWFSSLF